MNLGAAIELNNTFTILYDMRDEERRGSEKLNGSSKVNS